jgi:short-subunit dehydrogenase
MHGARLFRGPWVMEAATVARQGYEGMMQGKPMVITGLFNRLLPQLARVSPRWALTRVARLLNERVRG